MRDWANFFRQMTQRTLNTDGACDLCGCNLRKGEMILEMQACRKDDVGKDAVRTKIICDSCFEATFFAGYGLNTVNNERVDREGGFPINSGITEE